MDMEEFRIAIQRLRAQSRRAYDEQLEVVRLLREKSRLQRESLLSNMNGDDYTDSSVCNDEQINGKESV
jgi:hypothetical protein